MTATVRRSCGRCAACAAGAPDAGITGAYLEPDVGSSTHCPVPAHRQNACIAARAPIRSAPVPRGATAPTRDGRPVRYRPLLRRVLLVNTAVLTLSCLVTILVFSPGTLSSLVAIKELAIFSVSLLAMLVLNRGLLAGLFSPLERITAAMRRADPLKPGERVPVPDRASEASDVAVAFNDMVERLEDERRASARRALSAQEDERLRIARELHDEVGQQLTALLLQLTSARRGADSGSAPALGEAQQLAREAFEDVRRVAQELRPEALEDLGLTSALAALGERFGQRTGLQVAQQVDPVLPPLSAEEELVIYRVAQEALTNVVRHAGVDRAELTLRVLDGTLRLTVSDDGGGFEPAIVPSNGLLGMRERALLVTGDLTVRSAPGEGTEIRLELPLNPR